MRKSHLALRYYDQADFDEEIKRKQDEFLDVYSFYLQSRISWIHDEVNLKAYELHMIDASFKFNPNLHIPRPTPF